MKNHYRLNAWIKGTEIVLEIYKILEKFPKHEIYWIADQMRRASVSIPGNIAEWSSRETSKEKIRFYYIARGSCAEIDTQVYLSEKLWYIPHEQAFAIQKNIDDTSNMLSWLIRSEKNKIQES